MKYTLQSLNPLRLTHAEAGDMVARTLSQLGSLPPAPDRNSDAYLTKYLPGLTQRHEAYYKALNQNGADAMTEVVKLADHECDMAASNLNKAVKLGKHSDVPAEKEASRVIGILMANYKGLAEMNYGQKTENICTLLNDLAAPALATHIKSLNLQRYITRLKTANDAFAALRDNRSITKNLTEARQVKEMRQDMLTFYKETCLYIQSMANANDGGYDAQLLALINGVRKQYADLLARRISQPETTPAPAAN
jgi:hypothetical protein